MDIDKIKLDSVGRWSGIMSALGIAYGDGRHCPCPICGGKDRFRFTDLEGRGTYICNQCGSGDGFSLLQKVLNVDFKGACEAVGQVIGVATKNPYTQEKEVTPEKLRELYQNSNPIKKNDGAYRYLKNRGLNKIPQTLRYTTKCYNTDTKKYEEAMLATFQAPDGKALTIHRTYLKNGKKLEVKDCKKFMKALNSLSGGAIRLYPKASIMGVCEGIETAIAIFESFNIPVWPCCTAILLEQWEPPEGVEQIRVYSDNDWNYTGQKAAYTLANRLAIKHDLHVTVWIAKNNDFLDDLISK